MSDATSLDVFDRRESEVRGYVRAFPTVFDRASGSTLVDADGREYLDFFAGAGVLNYGHNNPAFTKALIEYLEHGGIIHGLDMATSAKRAFIEAFERLVLEPRGLDHKLQFTGPTGANAVEAALKVARRATGRSTVVAFTNAFHGLSLGSLAATGNSHYRGAAGVGLDDVARLPYDGYLGPDVDTLDLFEKMLDDSGSGLDLPAAVIVEAVQGEGGINVASPAWLQRLRRITEERGILLILDEIQAGIGRTGAFFAFEESGIVPDLVTVSKSISGSGLPMSLVLLRPGVDVWKPGQHTGTFRGNNLAFVSARIALETYWSDGAFMDGVAAKSALLVAELEQIAAAHPELGLTVRGRGLFQGLVCDGDRTLAGRVSKAAFQRGLVIETSGAFDEVLKFLPALTITEDELRRGLAIVRESLDDVLADAPLTDAATAG
ncbi:diaminobutyrate--2-oxoglutarate transaminase [Agromyces sp. LHK192]|uniref:diaminobutyrate--2-oxoglutarate transaminase n=1 Tax=Agromyces sp. LHK192 TaxID=2498704 RepID=UPI000FDB1A5D|nr:diaminobutyrate--2-oxoglutarate transaminase [Agromyces sp. LHK192]